MYFKAHWTMVFQTHKGFDNAFTIVLGSWIMCFSYIICKWVRFNFYTNVSFILRLVIRNKSLIQTHCKSPPPLIVYIISDSDKCIIIWIYFHTCIDYNIYNSCILLLQHLWIFKPYMRCVIYHYVFVFGYVT